MQVIHGLKKIGRYSKPVVAVGVFDGVHLGHRRILKAAVKKARQINGTSMVLTFWPHPQQEESLYSLEHRLRLISQQGIEVCAVVNFNRNFRQVSALKFIREILVKKLHPAYLYLGENFRFGKNQEGNIRALQRFSAIYDYRIKVFAVLKVKNRPVSSTCIRRLIKKGDLNTASKLLAHPVSVLGTVARGASIARKLGFPTANINPHHEVIPPSGVYAVKVILNKRMLAGVCNIGRKPTFGINREKQIELHILDFRKNIYAKFLEIQFIKKIREEKKFPSSRALSHQIKKDVLTARRLFLRH